MPRVGNLWTRTNTRELVLVIMVSEVLLELLFRSWVLAHNRAWFSDTIQSLIAAWFRAGSRSRSCAKMTRFVLDLSLNTVSPRIVGLWGVGHNR